MSQTGKLDEPAPLDEPALLSVADALRPTA